MAGIRQLGNVLLSDGLDRGAATRRGAMDGAANATRSGIAGSVTGTISTGRVKAWAVGVEDPPAGDVEIPLMMDRTCC